MGLKRICCSFDWVRNYFFQNGGRWAITRSVIKQSGGSNIVKVLLYMRDNEEEYAFCAKVICHAFRNDSDELVFNGKALDVVNGGPKVRSEAKAALEDIMSDQNTIDNLVKNYLDWYASDIVKNYYDK